MKNNLSRRSFFVHSVCGIGTVALTGLKGFSITTASKESVKSDAKKLFATTDFVDNILINERGSRYGPDVKRTKDYYEKNRCFFDKNQLDDLHKYLESLGVTHHQWIVDTMWTLYEDYPHGFDLLEEAAKSAHKFGIRFYAVIKLFEGGCFGEILPHTMPCPAGVAMSDLRGIFPRLRPFVAQNLKLNMKRRPGTYECSGTVSTIRLVKSDSRPTQVKTKNLSLWTSCSNNGFVPYNGPVSFRESVEKRYCFPSWRECRIIHLEGLKIPDGHRYFLIRCSLADENGDFSNEKGNILELVSSNGEIIRHTLSTGPVSLDQHYKSFYRSKVKQKLIRYLQLSEVQEEVSNHKKMEEHYRNYYGFGEYNPNDWTTIDKEGYVAAVCGKPEYIPGHLHPVYSEVREHWLDLIRFCLDRGVDGINLRISNHTLAPENWEYGFNEPILKAAQGKTDYKTISRINGDAYTSFLYEARDLIKSKGKSVAIHLETELLMPDDRPGKLSSYPSNFEWQWETWIKEVADEFELRGIFRLRPWNMSKAIDIFSMVTRSEAKPLYLQGDFHGMTFDGPFSSIESETDIVNNHDGLDGYVLYETANLTRINENWELEGNQQVKSILRKLRK